MLLSALSASLRTSILLIMPVSLMVITRWPVMSSSTGITRGIQMNLLFITLNSTVSMMITSPRLTSAAWLGFKRGSPSAR